MAVHVVSHPVLTHKVSVIRDVQTKTREFRDIVSEITLLLTYEATRDIPTTEKLIKTPLCETKCQVLADEGRIVLIPILRAGLGMVPGMLQIFPLATVSHLGIKRDEQTAKPTTYFFNVKENLEGATVIVVDPMLATGGSLNAALALIKRSRPKLIRALCLIAAPEGRANVEREHPDVDVYVGAMDSHLNEKSYIVPGLGDAGDRMFGT